MVKHRERQISINPSKKLRIYAFDTILRWPAGLTRRPDEKSMRLILASVSPRRRELVRQCGIECELRSADIEEIPRAGEAPEATALRLAREKARAALRCLKGRDAWILAADTVVADGAAVLGKPRDAGQAREYLLRLRGREHRVITGVCLLHDSEEKEFTAVEITGVRMRDYSPAKMEDYLAGGDGMDKAGAYAIQDSAFQPVESLAGCYTNVVGLPLCRVYELLERAGGKPGRPLPESCRAGGVCGFDEREFPRANRAPRRATS
jgi:septum formation protein